MNLSAFLEAQSKRWIIAAGFALSALIGVLDFLSGWDVSLFLLYALPILIVTWYGGRRAATACAVACGIIWFLANYNVHNYASTSAYAWAAINRLVYLLFVAVGGFALKRQQEEMRGHMDALMRTRELEQEIVRVSEREQMRIGQDLHDGLCQNLAAIDCAAACLRADLEARALPEADTARMIQSLLKDAVVEARNLARGIFPVQMDAEGLPAALQELVSTTNRLRQVPVMLEVHGDVKIGDPQVGMHLYRIAQEALSNAVRHAEAHRVDIELTRETKGVTMIIADNGRGFRALHSSSPGMGLRTMRYRARLIDAEFSVDTQPAGGTLIRCCVPLAHHDCDC
jgi:signal transduction histidine kinase